MAVWDPSTYLRFGSERARPFLDLLARVAAEDPGYVVDLGCGPGNLTALLAARWPRAQVLGVDNSPEMIDAAQAEAVRVTTAQAEAAQTGAAAGPGGNGARPVPGPVARLSFALGDVRTWRPARPVDMFTCNAVLQWVPGHDELLTTWASWLAPGGWLAFQLPGNFDQPSHVLLRELASTGRWQPRLAGVELNRQAGDPAAYLDLLAQEGCEVDAWETTYLHVLRGADTVLDWYRGTALRPVRTALTAAEAAEFEAEYGALLQAAYPPASYGTVLPFRRVFVVARR